MIVLDTNVVSELSKPTPDPIVVAWVDAQTELAIAAPALGELRFGVARLPAGKRRTTLSEAIDQFVTDDLGGLVLPFDVASADAYGLIVAARERVGTPIGIADAQIAAICHIHDAVLATRNVRDFLDTGIDLVNPWDPPDTAVDR
ncbi:MAG: type II toxin-antitoxin system VapC family toxin [Solirubrobacteraceae bacterium]